MFRFTFTGDEPRTATVVIRDQTPVWPTATRGRLTCKRVHAVLVARRDDRRKRLAEELHELHVS